MIHVSDHPLTALVIALLNYPVYLALGAAIFGNRQAFIGAMKYLKTPSTWSPLRDPWSSDWKVDLKILFFVGLCIAYVASLSQLCLQYVL